MAACTGKKYFDMGKPCPVVMSFGHHPLLFISGCTDVPVKMSEFAYAGGVLGEPIQLVRGPPHGSADSGLFGNRHRRRNGSRRQPARRSVRRMARLLRQRHEAGTGGARQSALLSEQSDPVRRAAAPSVRRSGFHRSIQRSALIWNALEDAGVPDVKGVWLHPAGYRFFSILKIKQRYPGHAKQAALIASQCRPGAYLGSYVVVVDDDIDIYNPDDVIWAMARAPSRRTSTSSGAAGAARWIR